ncbi:INO80_2 [Blepharisma stoltei]|uniref:Chromatin-remodeling ATPase INO80 n=1 Tax=Blepharisma stoltei TaxID=1481888 RepID=A0AAU9K4U4_9CILI|nr:unnamed protein product [Blepharisma stoltei]
MSTSGRDLSMLAYLLRNTSERSVEFTTFEDQSQPIVSLETHLQSPLLSLPSLSTIGTPLLPQKRQRYELEVRGILNSSKESPCEDGMFPYKALKLNNRAHKIEHYLKKVCELSETEEEERAEEENLLKKAYEQDFSLDQERYLGLRRSDIMAIKKYQLDPNKLPKLSFSFESFRPEQLSALLARVKPTSALKIHNTSIRKITASKEFPRAPTKVQKPRSTSKSVSEKVESILIKKALSFLIKRDLPKAFKGMQKQRGDLRNNCKRISQLCSKEVAKKAGKMQREAKEAPVRAKRLQREMVSYWKRKERETADMRRKREREENETRKKREEEEESLRQRKKLEYIMRQSDIYAIFMAQKLGIMPTATTHVSSIGVDEDQARESVKTMIKEHRDHLKQFGDTSNMNNEDLKDVGLTGLDRVDETKIFSRIEETPPIFTGDLKDYQMKGLRWLDNLYDQGINGILADEMGLGKTIQTIALLAHLAYNKNIWGPFLIVCPASTLHNWLAELNKFCPTLKTLPYWGQMKERKSLRRYMQNKKLGNDDSSFHVCVTSYQLVLADEKNFQKVMWKYMILDEAHAIKNTATQRWNVLLGFNARNKLLLTGTPIQNSMAELWALLHFIMPKLFDSHEHFEEWFSKDIEAHSQDAGALNQQQLQRLHAILKPFMLRRVKKDVESEIGKKTEHEYFCELTNRQKMLYSMIKRKLNISELFSMADSKTKVENLMNLMMQFRKVCNHPDLFERRPEHTPITFKDPLLQNCQPKPGFNQLTEVRIGNKNPINFNIPRIVYNELYLENKKLPSIFDTEYFWFFKLLGMSYNEGIKIIESPQLIRGIIALHYIKRYSRLIKYEEAKLPLLVYRNKKAPLKISDDIIPRILVNLVTPVAVAAPIEFSCSTIHFKLNWQYLKQSPALKKNLLGNQFKPSFFYECQGQNIDIPFSYCFNAPTPCYVDLPSIEKLLHDSAKLKILDRLLKKLYDENHRVLIFCQMTKMLDILEDFLYFRKYSFLRLDGSTNIAERRDLIDDFQSSTEVFAFILSTRAGGLGVNLTAADTVIFYDIDWNPTMDAQATDRVHRIGQTKPVDVYRLITSHTVEEKILKRAKQKQTVQTTVYAGGAFKADIFRPSELTELLLDDNEFDHVSHTKMFIGMNKRPKKPQKEKKEEKTSKETEGFNITEFVESEIS